MARRGRFGRLPRTAPDLTSTIVSILREYQGQRDQNIQEAWEKGGTFEGKKVTDTMILDHWQGRRDEVSKDDPLWDTYNQSVNNMTFGISNSKQELGYAQGKINDRQMGNFYRSWAAKYPQDSEAWRRMMTLAAQYDERAKNLAASGRRAAKGRSYSNNLRESRGKEIGFDSLTDVLQSMALSKGILNTEDEDLMDLRAYEQDSRNFMQLIDEFNTSKDPYLVNYRAYLTGFIKQNGNPNFDGDFSYASWMQMRADKTAGITTRLRLAQQSGRASDVKSIHKELTDFTTESLRYALIDEVAAYEEFRGTWDSITHDPNADVITKLAATQTYESQVNGLYQRAQQERGYNPEVGSVIEGHLGSELRGLHGEYVNEPTLWDDSRGQSAGAKADPTKSDAYQTADSVNKMNRDIGYLLDGTHVQTYVNEDGQPVTSGGGTIGVVPLTALGEGTAYLAGTVGVPQISIVVTGADGKQTVRTASTNTILRGIVGAPVYAEGQASDANGNPISGKTIKPIENVSDLVAYEFQMPDGESVWKYTDASGQTRYSTVPPFNGVAQKQLDGTSIVTVQVAPGMQTFNPTSAVSQNYLSNADALGETVFHSAMAAWMSSAAKDSRGVPSIENDAVRAALQAESRGDPRTYLAALGEMDGVKADYLTSRPNAVQTFRALRRTGESIEMIHESLGSKERGAVNQLVSEAEQEDARLRQFEEAPGVQGYAYARALPGPTDAMQRTARMAEVLGDYNPALAGRFGAGLSTAQALSAYVKGQTRDQMGAAITGGTSIAYGPRIAAQVQNAAQLGRAPSANRAYQYTNPGTITATRPAYVAKAIAPYVPPPPPPVVMPKPEVQVPTASGNWYGYAYERPLPNMPTITHEQQLQRVD